jgi:uncharacterized membrane protein
MSYHLLIAPFTRAHDVTASPPKGENPVTFEVSVDIVAPPIRVFEFVADFSTMPKWHSAVHSVMRVCGTGELGTQYEVRRQLLGRSAVNVVEVTSYAPGEVIAFTSLRGPTPFVYRYGVHPLAAATRLTLEGTIGASGLPGPSAFLGQLVERLFTRGMRDNLGTLRTILEQ